MSLIYGHDQTIAAWVASQIPHVGAGSNFGPCVAIGVVRHDKLAAGVVFHDFQTKALTMQISCAATSPLWATRRTLHNLLRYPFTMARAQKIWVSIPHTNERAIRFNKGIGMKQEAVLRRHYGPKTHAVILSMLRHEYLAKYEADHG